MNLLYYMTVGMCGYKICLLFLVAQMCNQNYKPQEDGDQVLFTDSRQDFAHKKGPWWITVRLHQDGRYPFILKEVVISVPKSWVDQWQAPGLGPQLWIATLPFFKLNPKWVRSMWELRWNEQQHFRAEVESGKTQQKKQQIGISLQAGRLTVITKR